MLPTCGPAQSPYYVYFHDSGDAYFDATGGTTPADSCRKMVSVAYDVFPPPEAPPDVVYLFGGATDQQCFISGLNQTFPIVPQCVVRDGSPFDMSVADGLELSGLILSVWVSAAVWRWATRTLGNRGDDE